MEPTILEQLVNLRQATLQRKIDWIMTQPSNPNVIRWDRTIDGKTFSITIQKQPVPPQPGKPSDFFYFFTIIKANPLPASIMIQLNSQIEPQYKDALESLYLSALDSAKQKFGSIFNDLLKDL